MTDTAVYLYAVTESRHAALPRLAGVSGSPVRVVEHAGLAAVVSTVPLSEYGERALRENLENLAWLEATARAHHAVVRAVAALAPTAPVRLATVFHDDRRVGELLAERQPGIRQALSRVAGRAEWGVKVYGTAQVGPLSRTGDEGSRPGTAYLRRRGAQRRGREDAARSLADRAEQAHDRLASHAIACHRHRLQDRRLSRHDGVMALNAAYLIEDSHAFAEAAAELATRWDDMRVEVTGPWPAYSFTTIEERERAVLEEGERTALEEREGTTLEERK
ncbi:GvpL/GvpF family gas vesicle protein [Nonomuraea basaltis]|uniref:GvpL/GvpF family gas vesicle protein n=1 Tax=Nonomuraea basaltis TaxID=2495887 RepID=UPI00110C4EAB|nr:GvpL/GvpF family gas vesicle protein [Nonomuraea basaltis]TMR97962.1 GvpL/GvpF family gas vesicle protein [Nonomuraea basaltis]